MPLEKIVSFLLIPIILIGFFVFLIISGPKDIDYSSPGSIAERFQVSKEVEDIRLKSFELESNFEELVSLGEVNKENILLLEEAIKLQESYINEVPFHGQAEVQRLSYLKERYDQVLSKKLYDISVEKEILSKKLYEESDFQASLKAINEAVSYQRKINELYPLSTYSDINRTAKLNRRLYYLKAYPEYQKVLNLEGKVDLLKKSGKWIEAADLLNVIIEKQLYINSEYRSSDLADGLKLNALKLEEVSCRSRPIFNEVNDFENRADSLVEEGRFLRASVNYDEAMNLQLELNNTYPGSPFSSLDKVNELNRKKQTAASYELGELINSLNFEIDNDLRRRKLLLAKDKILRIADAIEKMNEEFPLSSYNDDELKSKIKFLNFIRGDIDLIQDRIYDNLIKVPDEPGIKMLKTEVSQALYSIIAGSNPSRFIGNKMPVESVSWKEANDFCMRLSWVMGLRVRLPHEHEFRSAIGRLRYVKIEEFVISSLDGGKLYDVASKEPLGKGFYDLLGNVSEWLSSDVVFDDEMVKHIGGHFNDRLNTIYAVPIRAANRNERSRLIGFRFVLE